MGAKTGAPLIRLSISTQSPAAKMAASLVCI